MAHDKKGGIHGKEKGAAEEKDPGKEKGPNQKEGAFKETQRNKIRWESD
jgi:hypothetical protein